MHGITAPGWFATWLLFLAAYCLADCGKRPNIIFILTDDQDLQMDSLNYMPLLDKYVRQEGTFYSRHYCTTAVCCPARYEIS
jgi:arylsulfatase A-like enzyme